MKRMLGVVVVLTIGCITPAYAEKAKLCEAQVPNSITSWYQGAISRQQPAAAPSSVNKFGGSRVQATEEADCIACAVYSVSWQYRMFVRAVAGFEGSIKFQLDCAKSC